MAYGRFVVVWAIGLALSARFRKDGAIATSGFPTRHAPGPLLDASAAQAPRVRRRAQARIIGIAAAGSVVVGAAWTQFVGSRLTRYIDPILSSAYADFGSVVGNLHGNRQLFKDGAGAVTPKWDVVLILGSAAAWRLLLVPSLYSVVVRRSVRGGPLRYLPAVIAATYPFLILGTLSTDSKVVAGRVTAFTFFGVAVILGAWLAGRIARVPGWSNALPPSV